MAAFISTPLLLYLLDLTQYHELHTHGTNLKCIYLNSFPNDKLKELADDNSKFDENGIKFSKRVENTVGKGEIARYKQFLLFPQCFQKTCTADTKEPGLV